MNGLYPNIFSVFGISRTINHRNSPSRKDRRINLLYSSSKSLSFSVKKSKARHIQIPKMKNQNKSYFALKTKALIQVCCNHTAKSSRIIVVIMNINMNWIMNFDSMFLSNNFQVILSVFSLFFMALIRHFKFVKMYRSSITININNINSFHIQNNVRNLPSRPSLNVTNVCKKNCNKSQITKILHNRLIRKLIGLEQILDRRDVSFFMMSKKKT